jgi:putative nucleotidyltransferase with HDIG domain
MNAPEGAAGGSERAAELLQVTERLKEIGSSDPESEVFLAEVASELAQATSSEKAVVSLVDGATGSLEVQAAYGFGFEPPRDLSYIQDGIHGWVLKIGAPMVLEMPDQEGGLPLLPFERTSLLAAPIQVQDNRLGVVCVLRPTKSARYLETDALIVSAVASLVGGMIGHARASAQGREAVRKTIESLTVALDARDPYTRGHSQRVAMYSVAIANELERGERYTFGKEMRNSLLMSALLHDIGKIGIRDEILFKPEKLTPEEYDLIKSHPDKGADIVRMVPGFDEEIIAGILQHHERFDGKGYPAGFAGENIHIFGRIIGLADTFDAIVTSRPYNTAASFNYAMSRVEELSGTAFDPEVVRAMLSAVKDQGIWNELAAVSETKTAPETGKAETHEPDVAERTLRRIFGRGIKDLPTLPHVVSQVLEKTRDSNANLSDIVKLVSADQALVSTYLKLVNSAFYGFSRRITTLKQAITLLGFKSVRNIVVNAGVVGVFRRRAFNTRHRHRLWDHSVACAVAARALAERKGYKAKEEAFTAGLLHDIGKVVIDQYAPKHSAAIMHRVEAGAEPRAAEEEVLGVDHTKIGAWIADRWHLPKTLCWVIEYHHEPECPEIPGDADLIRLISAANGLCKVRNAGDADVVERSIEDYVASPQNLLELGLAEAREVLVDTWAGKAEAMKTFGPGKPSETVADREDETQAEAKP